MTGEVSSNQNTLDVSLSEYTPEITYGPGGIALSSVPLSSMDEFTISQVTVPVAQVSYKSPVVNLAIPSVQTTKKIICYDTETSGINPWESQLYVCSFWDISKPVNEIITFFGWEERKLTQEIADYLNEEKPDALLCYNNGFDQRFLLSRFMLYQIQVPGWCNIDQYDLMDILKKGTTKSIASSQSPGAEEQWLQFFFNESKPFTIDECFEGIRDGDLTKLIIRNRTCVESEGSIYLLFMYATQEGVELPGMEKPTAVNIEEAQTSNICAVKCLVCDAVNTVLCDSQGNACWRCMSIIPDPTEANRVKEVLRQFDITKVGLSTAKSS